MDHQEAQSVVLDMWSKETDLSVLKRILLALTSPVWFPVCIVALLLAHMTVALACGLWGVFVWVKTGNWGGGEKLWKRYLNYWGLGYVERGN